MVQSVLKVDESMPTVQLSIVIPVYHGEELVPTLIDRLVKALDPEFYNNYEIVLVEDGSTEASWAAIIAATAQYPQIVALRLSRNFGQHIAITAGLDACRGDVVVVMDCDLQDRPEEIPVLVAKLRSSTDVDCVIALRTDRQDDLRKKLVSRIFYWLLNLFTGMELDYRAANFGAYSRRVVNAITSFREHDRSFPFLVHWVGFKKAYLPVCHERRAAGRSGYTFLKLMRLALNTAMSVSDRPMKIVMALGALMSFSGFVMGAVLLVRYFLGLVSEPGYASVILSVWFFCGIIVLLMGFVGLYVGKIFLAVKSRPLYLLSEKVVGQVASGTEEG